MEIFKLCSLHCFLDDYLLQFLSFSDLLVELRALFSIDSLLALGTVEVSEDDSGAVVAFLYLLHDAFKVESVTTT